MSLDLNERINSLYTNIKLILSEVAVLKKELDDSDVSKGSAREGIISDQEKNNILLTRNKKKFNNPQKK